MGHTLILNYHSIVNNRSTYHVDPIYSIKEEVFRKHMALIQKLQLDVITINNINSYKEQHDLKVCLTFDDGFKSDYEIVYPILNEFNYKASFFITLKNIADNNSRWDQYCELSRSGNIIGSHGISHKYLSELDKESQRRELSESKEIIENKINKEINYFSLPGGRYNNTTIKLAKDIGYNGLLTTNFGLVENIQNIPFLIDRWSIKTSTNLELFEGVLLQNKKLLSKLRIMNNMKKKLQKIINSRQLDRLNYFLYK